jgi:hypothetical protein
LKTENFYKSSKSLFFYFFWFCKKKTFFFTIALSKPWPPDLVSLSQGGQIGLLFSYWAIICFGQFIEKHRKKPNFSGYFLTQKKLPIKFDPKQVGLHFWRFFSQTHPDTLVSYFTGTVITDHRSENVGRIFEVSDCTDINFRATSSF